MKMGLPWLHRPRAGLDRRRRAGREAPQGPAHGLEGRERRDRL